jgi:hypothetical protein
MDSSVPKNGQPTDKPLQPTSGGRQTQAIRNDDGRRSRQTGKTLGTYANEDFWLERFKNPENAWHEYGCLSEAPAVDSD